MTTQTASRTLTIRALGRLSTQDVATIRAAAKSLPFPVRVGKGPTGSVYLRPAADTKWTEEQCADVLAFAAAQGLAKSYSPARLVGGLAYHYSRGIEHLYWDAGPQ